MPAPSRDTRSEMQTQKKQIGNGSSIIIMDTAFHTDSCFDNASMNFFHSCSN